MPHFSLTDFLAYALWFIQTHPSAQVICLATGILLAAKVALHVEAEQRRIEDERERRAAIIAQAQQAYREQALRLIRSTHK